MKRLKFYLVPLFLLFLLVSTAYSFEDVKVLDWTPYAYEDIVVTNAAVFRPAPAYRAAATGAGALFLTVEFNNIRYRIDGGNPTIGQGHPIIASSYQNFWISDRAAIRNLRMIATGGNATVRITYYRRQ